MDILEQIEDYARQAHGDQRRVLEDKPYIVHPIRVMKICTQYTDALPVLGAALLHDVLEDTAVSPFELNDFLAKTMGVDEGKQCFSLVQELTDEFTKNAYPQWNRRKRKSHEIERLANCSASAQTIKYADIIDNSETIIDVQNDFAVVFLREVIELLKRLDKGDERLYRRAKDTTIACLAKTGDWPLRFRP